jgi:hypothetical protein
MEMLPVIPETVSAENWGPFRTGGTIFKKTETASKGEADNSLTMP